MAQRPWEVLRERSLTLLEANRFLKKARSDLLSTIFIPHRSDVRKTSVQNVKSRPPCSDLILSSLQDLSRKLDDKRLVQTSFLDTSGVLKKCHIRGLVQLWPVYISYPTYGTMKYLNDNFALQYIPELNGVVLAFRKITSTESEAFSYESEPSGVMVFNINVDALLFSPQAGQILVGEITEIQEGFVMCVVLGIWLARIPANELPDGAIITSMDNIPSDNLLESSSSRDTDENHFVVVLKKNHPLNEMKDTDETIQSSSKKTKSNHKSIMKRKSVVKFLVVKVLTSGRDSSIQSAAIIIEGSMR